MDILEIGNIVEVVVVVVATIWAYFRFRGRNFGLTDLFIFVPLAAGADWLVYWLLHDGIRSADYGALVALLVGLGLLPVAVGLSIVAIIALSVCFGRYPAVRIGVLGALVLLFVVHYMHGHKEELNAPGGMLNNDRLAGENWGMESGARSTADCDRQSGSAAFRQGCYAALRR